MALTELGHKISPSQVDVSKILDKSKWRSIRCHDRKFDNFLLTAWACLALRQGQQP